MSPVIDVELDEAAPPGFETRHTIWNMGGVVMTSAELPASGRRRFQHRSKEALDHWCLVLAEAAPGQGVAGARLTDRLMGMRSLGRSFEAAVADTHVLSLYIPRDFLPASAGILDAAEGNVAPSGLAALLADYLTALERRLPQLGVGEMGPVAEATSNIIAACLAPNADRMEAALPAANWTLVERARRAIQLRMAKPDFSPEELCRMIGTSRSKLYRLFEPFGGVTHYMQRQRLRAAHALLAEPGNTASIARIAEQVGFLDLSSFSRAFRREFDLSPSEVRSLPGLAIRRAGAGEASAPAAFDALGSALRGLYG